MAYISPSKEELLASIKPDMLLTRGFFKRIYGYEISFPGFAKQAIETLEAAGCSKAKKYYENWVSDYEKKREKELKAVAIWYGQELRKRWEKQKKEGEVKRTNQQEMRRQNKVQRWEEMSELLNYQSTKTER